MTTGNQSISVKHNIEVAHRLFQTPGKCENIHGHSMWVTLTLFSAVNEAGMLAGIDFGKLKTEFRGFLDSTYDHRLLLNKDDPWAQPMHSGCNCYPDAEACQTLPGLVKMGEDPTTENIAKWIGQHVHFQMGYNQMEAGIAAVAVEVWETNVNQAAWRSDW